MLINQILTSGLHLVASARRLVGMDKELHLMSFDAEVEAYRKQLAAIVGDPNTKIVWRSGYREYRPRAAGESLPDFAPMNSVDMNTVQGNWQMYSRIGRFLVIGNSSTAISWYMSQLPGCCGVCVSHDSCVMASHQHKKLATICMGLKKAIAKQLGFTMMLVTDKDYNIYNTKVFDKHGFKPCFEFKNARTSNAVTGRWVKL